jgi:hypothetical protein
MGLLPQRCSTGWIPRHFEDLDEPLGATEDVLHVPGARVAVADYVTLRCDFPHLAGFSDGAIDEWLVAHAAWIARAQAQQTVVNSRIATSDRAAHALRPPLYGRSVIVQAPGGLLDLKGAGVRPGNTPSHENHSSGLEYLGVALGDFMLKAAIDAIFERAAPEFFSVPVYAIIDLGFDITNGWRGTAPAGLHVRRAHRRARGGGSLPNTGSWRQFAQFEVEMTLRSYGLTSATVASSLEVEVSNGSLIVRDGGTPVSNLSKGEIAFFRSVTRGVPSARFERVNVQLTRRCGVAHRGEVVDFGHYHVRPRFDNPLCSTVGDRPFCLGPVMWPEDPAYIQPDPALHVPSAVWHRPNLNVLCFDLAARFGDSRCTRAQLLTEMENPLLLLCEQWSVWRQGSDDRSRDATSAPRAGNR